MKVYVLFPTAVACIIGAGCWALAPASKGSATPAPAPSSTPYSKATPSPSHSPDNAKDKIMEDPSTGKNFIASLASDFEQPSDDAGKLLLREYGSVFVTRGGAVAPKKVVFKDEADVSAYQAKLDKGTANIGGTNVQLQRPALNALNDAIAEARTKNLTISPRGGDSAKRTYKETVDLWASRVGPGLSHWVAAGKITQADADRIRKLSPYEQVPAILDLEKSGMFFAKDLSKSIIYSVAPPGTSQHLSMLAFDVKEFENPEVREIMMRHGWFQTVSSDLPHFTYLGVTEADLPGLGLKKIDNSGRRFWVPDL